MHDEVHRMSAAHLAAQERASTGQLGLIVRGVVSVKVRKPRWMPDSVYRWLLRTIVVESSPLRIERLTAAGVGATEVIGVYRSSTTDVFSTKADQPE
jgi:hypothetical protein